MLQAAKKPMYFSNLCVKVLIESEERAEMSDSAIILAVSAEQECSEIRFRTRVSSSLQLRATLKSAERPMDSTVLMNSMSFLTLQLRFNRSAIR